MKHLNNYPPPGHAHSNERVNLQYNSLSIRVRIIDGNSDKGAHTLSEIGLFFVRKHVFSFYEIKVTV